MTSNLNLSNMVLSSKSVTSDLEYLITENDGHFQDDSQYMIFDHNGIEVVVWFQLDLRGVSSIRRGSYMEPDEYDFNITNTDIDITSVTVNDEEIEYDEIESQLIKLVTKNI
jgi:hypothetical protein